MTTTSAVTQSAQRSTDVRPIVRRSRAPVTQPITEQPHSHVSTAQEGSRRCYRESCPRWYRGVISVEGAFGWAIDTIGFDGKQFEKDINEPSCLRTIMSPFLYRNV